MEHLLHTVEQLTPTSVASLDDYYLGMPPPKKRLKIGTGEFEEALRSGLIEISLPVPGQADAARCGGEVAGEAMDLDEDVRIAGAPHNDEGLVVEQHQRDDGRQAHVSVVSNEDSSDSDSAMRDDSTFNDTSASKFQSPDPTLPRFKDIIGHGHAKLRIEELLLPMALPLSVTNSVLTGASNDSVCCGIGFCFYLNRRF